MKTLARKHLRDVMILVGFGWIVAGAWRLHSIAGMLVLGVGLVVAAVMMPELPPDGEV